MQFGLLLKDKNVHFLFYYLVWIVAEKNQSKSNLLSN